MKNPYLSMHAFGKHNDRLLDLIPWDKSKVKDVPVGCLYITDYTNYLVGTNLNSKY